MRSAWLLTLAAVAAPVWAHHSFAAEFDRTKVVRLEGTITRMEWVNPHAMIHLAVTNADGTVENWRIEGNTPNSLLRVGLTKKSLAEGTKVIVTGYRARSGERIASAGGIRFEDGRQLALGPDKRDAAAVLVWVSSDEELWKLQLAAQREANAEAPR